MKTIKFYTLGCKVNQYDTQSIRESFLNQGFRELFNGRKADYYLINTCSVTASADSKSRNAIRNCVRENPCAKIIVTGCLAKKDALMLGGIRGITYVIGKEFFPERGISNFCGHARAFLKIQDGCDNFCTYCKVPLVRGNSRSKKLSLIIKEAVSLSQRGFKEIVLTGICLGAYGKDLKPQKTLVDVIEKIESLAGIERIRLSSIEAGDVSDKLIAKVKNSKKLCRHLHIPMQSGDDFVLHMMNRRYRRKDYLNLVRKIRNSIPDIAISTDIIVGFPGETEDCFKNTLALVGALRPMRVHIFPYSARSGTRAGNLKQVLGEKTIKNRIIQLNQTAQKYAARYARRFLGKTADVLIECKAKNIANAWEGHTRHYLKAIVSSGADLRNQLLKVKFKNTRTDRVNAQLQ